ncbi:MAG: ABC transporter permease, partial [Gemmatimonadetes bacterium]|nr:ABC transporter permease [Gemmatimonadota bacterium]
VLALDQLRANKFRTALTVLGIVVGVATVMAMSAMVTGIRSDILSGIEAAGPKNFIVARFNWNEARQVDDHSPPWGDNPPIAVAEARAIARLEKVRTAIIDFDLAADFDAGKGEPVLDVQVSADDSGWPQFSIGAFVAGHDFTPAEVRASRPVVIISKPLAHTLFGSLDPIGRQVRINGRPFRVVGVYEVAENIFGQIIKHFAVVPYTTALKHLDADDDFLAVLVVTAAGARQQEAMDQAITAMRTMRGLRPGEANNFSVIRQEEMLRTFNRITGVFFLVMIALSSVALMVGGVGVIAVMMIAVTERTREIGIRKAIGATRHEILWQFLVEAATLTLVGAALGMLLGGSGAFLIKAATPVPASVPLWAIAAALMMAGIAGIAFGLWPAWRAARMDPVVALRYE